MKTFNTSTGIIIFAFTGLFALLLFAMYRMQTTTEVYTYHVKSFKESSKIHYIDNGTDVYVNHIYADLYDVNNQKEGIMYSINNHRIINGTNHVTTLTTYKTKKGTFSCNYYYETSETSHYLYGNIQNVITENETGFYEGKTIRVELDGKQDGTRELRITY